MRKVETIMRSWLRVRLALRVLLYWALCFVSATGVAQEAAVSQLPPQWDNWGNVPGFFTSAQDVCDARVKFINWFTPLTYHGDPQRGWRGSCDYVKGDGTINSMAYPYFGSYCPLGYGIDIGRWTDRWTDGSLLRYIYHAPGQLCVSSRTPRIDEPPDNYSPHRDDSCPVGHPCLPGSGTKTLTETDYQGAGAHPLVFTRIYHGYRKVSPDASLDGK
jgi:hypothetical protein